MKTKRISKETMFHVVAVKDDRNFKYDTILSTSSKDLAFLQYKKYKELYEFHDSKYHVCIIAKSYSVNVLFE